jgi:uncharacterized membrane protein
MNPAQFGSLGWLWTILHVPGFVPIKPPNFGLFVLYPLIPWIGVMAAGYAFGAILQLEPACRRKLSYAIGGAATLGFVVLRLFHLYGNPPLGLELGIPFGTGDWQVQKSLTLTVISFFNVAKYPPSLQFLLMTLGPMLVALAGLDQLTTGKTAGKLSRFFLVFGRVPMFYYVLHLFLIHALAIVVGLAFRQPVAWLWHGGLFFNAIPAGYGHGLPFVYLMWFVVIFILYFPCVWFMGVKQRRHDWWLGYI